MGGLTRHGGGGTVASCFALTALEGTPLHLDLARDFQSFPWIPRILSGACTLQVQFKISFVKRILLL